MARSDLMYAAARFRRAIHSLLRHCYLDWMERSLVRPRNRKIIAGVCAALAERFGISVTVVRLGFVLFGFFGVGELAYIALWILIPKDR